MNKNEKPRLQHLMKRTDKNMIYIVFISVLHICSQK
jgi:hypothetical protein